MFRLSEQPLILVLFASAALSMLVPALVALTMEDFLTARSFFYAGLIGLFVTLMIALARGRRSWTGRNTDLVGLLSLLAAYVIVPAYLAIPFQEALRSTSYLNAYVEMVSALTTTGAPLFESGRLPPALELWRAQVGWMGGLMIWVAAAAVLAPLNLGGFEVTLVAAPGLDGTGLERFQRAGILRRVIRSFSQLAPIYAVLTLILWVLLLVNGDNALVALCHAMSTMATSGISPVGGLQNGESGIAGEMVIFLFLIFALSRVSFTSDTSVSRFGLHMDPELRLGALIVLGVPVLLFLRHWIGAFEVNAGEDLLLGLRAFWGAIFTVLSFLTTNGFASADWDTAQAWSGLGTPGMILMGLAIMGGGVVGLMDDWIKVVRERSLGLNKRAKMLGLLAVAVTFAVLMLEHAPTHTTLSFTRADLPGVELGSALWTVWAVLLITGSANAVNLTDGLDGLAAGAGTFCFGAYTVIAFWQFRYPEAYDVAHALDLAVVAAAMAGGCLGFLWWNAAPARIFMGDTGSLAIGTGLAALSLATGTQLLLPIVAGLFVAETLSVIVQVGSYRLFGGRRVFRMAPIHHHFELGGLPETTVIIRFWIMSGLCTAVGVGIFYADSIATGVTGMLGQ